MGRVAQRQPIKGHPTYVRVQNSVTPPVALVGDVYVLQEQTLTTTVEALAGATSIDVAALTVPVWKNNWLLFIDSFGIDRLVHVTENADVGATSLVTSPLHHDIPSGSEADWPPEIWDQETADIDRQRNTSEVVTFNTGGAGVTVAQSMTSTWSCTGFYLVKNPGLQIVDWTFDEGGGSPFWMILEYPGEEGYSKGETLVWNAICTSAPRQNPANEFLRADRSGSFNGSPYKIAPVPVPIT